MRVIVNRQDLISCLSAAAKMSSCDTGGPVQSQSCRMFCTDGTLHIQMRAHYTDIEVELPASVECNGEPLQMHSKTLLHFVRATSGENIRMESDSQHLTLTGDTQHRMTHDFQASWSSPDPGQRYPVARFTGGRFAEALRMTLPFSSRNSEKLAYGVLWTLCAEKVSCVASDGKIARILDVLDEYEFVQAHAEHVSASEVYVEYPCVLAMFRLMDLWKDRGIPDTEWDCEMCIQPRVEVFADDSVEPISPYGVFDIAGAGYRVKVVTVLRHGYPEYAAHFPKPDDPGVAVAGNRQALCGLIEFAEQHYPRKPILVFRFSLDGPLQWRVGVVRDPKDDDELSILPCPYEVVSGLDAWVVGDCNSFFPYEYVSIDPKYLRMAINDAIDPFYLKFHRSKLPVEVISQGQSGAVPYTLFMPIRMDLEGDEL